MSTVTIEDAQARLPELLDRLGPGDEVLITRDGKPVARLLPSDPPKGPRVLGRGKGKVLFYIDDDEHLKDFADYMPCRS
jgi:prevent-host-death family protein